MPIQGGTVRWIIEADDSQFNQTADNVEKKAEEVASNLNKKRTSNFWSKLIGDTKGVGSAMKQMGSSLASIGWGTFQAGATGAVGALTSLVRKGLQATDFLETSRTAMAGLTGSIQAGNKAMSIAANYWQNNPFQRIDVTNATKQLVQFGRTTNQIGDDLEILGNVSLSTGTDIAELARYYARVSASGRAMTEDLEMMSDRGIPIYRELAKQLNTTQQGVRKMASDGKIDFETFQKAMESAVNPEAMESFENTLSRQTDRLKGSIQILAGQLAGYKIINDQLVISENGLEKAWTRLLKTLATELRSDKMKDALEKIGNALAKIIDKIAEFVPIVMGGLSKAISFVGDNSASLIPILGGVLALMGKLGGGLPIIGPILQSITGNVTGLFSSFQKLFSINPLIGTFLAIFAGGIVPALKNSEEFRNAIKSLVGALAKLAQSLGGAFKNILRIITTILSSDAVVGILTILAQLLANVAEVIASFPTNVLTTIVTAFLMFNLLKVSPLAGYTVAVLAFISVIKKFGPQILQSLKSGFDAVKNFFTTIGKDFATAAKNLATAGHNLMVGLANGIAEGSNKVFDYIKQIATSIVNRFKSIMGIHSPSTVMAEMGKNVTLGLAEGITDSKSVVQKAMDMLASDILDAIERVVDNKVDFGLLDYQSQYKEWKKISKMFTTGSQQYQYAIRKMEEARKQANLQILSLQKEYNDALDSTIEKVSSAYGLFDSVDTTGGKGAEAIISDLDQQVAALQSFASSKEIISGLDLADGLKEELQNMGVDASKELAAIAGMTGDQLAKLNELWVQKQAQSNRAAVTEMGTLKKETLQKVSEIKSGIDGETVSLIDSGGRLVENISEGVYGAMPTLDSALEQMDSYIAKAARELSKSGELSDAGADILDNLSDGFDTSIEDAKADFELSAKELGDSLISSLGGIVLGIAAFQFGPKILKALGGTTLGGKISGVFENLFGKKGKAVKEAAEAVTDSKTLASSTTNITNNISQMDSGMSKASSIMSTIIKGALTVVAIAGAIAAMAGALWVAHQLLGKIDLGRLAVELVLIAGVTAGMGAIAYAIGKAGLATMGKGLLVIVGIAGTLALVGLALGVVDKSITSDFGVLAQKIGAMALAVVAMGLLAAAIGAIMATGVAALVVGAGLVAMLAIAGAYALIALELKAIQSIELDEGAVVSKVNLIKDILEQIGPKGGVLDNIKDTVKLFLEVIKTVELGAIVALYKGIAENLNYIQNVDLHPDEIIAKVDLIKDVIDKIGNTGEGSITAQIRSVVATFLDLLKTVQVSLIVDTYAGMAENLEKIQNIQINKEEIVKKVQLLGEICDTVAKPTLSNGQDMWGALNDAVKMMLQAKATESAGKILGVYSDIGDTLGKLEKIDENCKYDSVQKAVTEVGKVVQLVIDMKGDGGILGKIGNFFTGNPITEEQVQNVVNILRKLGDIGSTINAIPGVYVDGAKEKIEAMKNVINKVGEIKDPGDLGTKEWVVGMATSIAYKLGELENALGNLKGEDKTGVVNTLLNTMNTLLTGVVNNLQNKLVDLETLGKNMAIRFKAGLDSQKDSIAKSGADLQGAIWNAIEPKLQDEYYQGQALANKLKEGFESVSFNNSGVNAVNGFINGATGDRQWGDLYRTGWNIADRFLQGLKARAGEHSPWATTKQSGIYAGEGLAEGIAKTASLVVNEAQSLVDEVTDVMSMDGVAINPEFMPTMGVADLPMMGSDESFAGGRSVEINQTNNNYTNYSMRKINDDLRWELSKI